MQRSDCGIKHGHLWCGVLLFSAVGCWIALAVCAFPIAFGIAKKRELAGRHEAGQMWVARIPADCKGAVNRIWLPPDYPEVWEGDQRLPLSRADEAAISAMGEGRYRVVAGKVSYSPLSPVAEGENLERPFYYVVSAWSVPEWFLYLLFGGGFFFAGAGLFFCPESWRRGAWMIAAVALLAGVAGMFLKQPEGMAVAFFYTLLVPALWAGAVALGLKKRCLPLLLLGGGVLLLPAAAMVWLYPWGGGSDGWFLFGGVFPWSDARLHFLQAAEIWQNGATSQAFNARFLYPLFAANLLGFAGGNPLGVHFLSAAMVLLSFALLAWLARPHLGVIGMWVLLLGGWFFYRAHGCGLWMTENAGLLLGAQGAAAWVLAGRSVNKHLFLGLPVRFWWALLGLTGFAWASAARPGALLVLPLLAAVAWWWAFPEKNISATWWGVWRVWLKHYRSILLSGLLLGLTILAPFGASRLAFANFYEGPAAPVGNFPFFLHGLLTDGNWQPSYEASGGDGHPIMQENLRMLREEPWRLGRGIARAMQEALGGFLFRWGDEGRLRSLGMLLLGAGLIAVWGLRHQRCHAVWLSAIALGTLLSTPFATPWDAGSRGYAATYPALLLLVGIGAAWLVACPMWWGRQAAEWWSGRFSEEQRSRCRWNRRDRMDLLFPPKLLDEPSIEQGKASQRLLVGAMVGILVLFWPWAQGAGVGVQEALQWGERNVAFLPGTLLLVGESEEAFPESLRKFPRVSRENFLDRSRAFRWYRREEIEVIFAIQSPFILAIEPRTWRNRVMDPAGVSGDNLVEHGKFWVDATLLPHATFDQP